MDQNSKWIFPTRPYAIVFVISLGSGRLIIPMAMVIHINKFLWMMQTLAGYWWDHCSVTNSLITVAVQLLVCFEVFFAVHLPFYAVNNLLFLC